MSMARNPQTLKKIETSKTKSGNFCSRKVNNPSQRNIQNIKACYETLFKRNFSRTNAKKQRFLKSVTTKTLTNEQYDLCENKISKTELFHSMKSMKNNKTPGNDGLTKEFFETFWDELKTPLMESVNQTFHLKILSIPQRQVVIKLIQKTRPEKTGDQFLS